MRIAVLTNNYPPEAQGGAGQIAFWQTEWFKSHGHTVQVFVPAGLKTDSYNNCVSFFKPQTAVPFKDLSRHNAFARLIFHFEDLAPNAEAVEAIRAYKPDVLITHNLTGCGWGTPLMLKNIGMEWLHLLHDVQMFEPSGQIFVNEKLKLLRGLWRKFWAKKRKKALGSPDVVVSPSQSLLDYHRLYDLFANIKTVVIPNPNPTDDCLYSSAQNNNQPAEDKDVKTVLYVGRVSKDKGIGVLLQSWKYLQEKYESQNRAFDLTLNIVGGGPESKHIQNLSDSSIRYFGQLNHSELEKFYSSADLFVFTSLLLENQPTVLLEALAYGLKIVAADVGGVGELLMGYGKLVKAADPMELAEAVCLELQKTPDKALGRQIVQKHKIDTVMQAYLSQISQ